MCPILSIINIITPGIFDSIICVLIFSADPEKKTIIVERMNKNRIVFVCINI